MKHQLYLTGLLLMTSSVAFAQSYFEDDIYYNPDKNKTTTAVKKQKKQSNYIANMAEMDVDTYNRRNQYYVTAIDTIGRGVENGEDFVYTQQIQKYYNPTIVVDNADLLGDVLANAYGNVEIVINDNGLPIFTPYYSYGWPYYNRWGWNIGSWGWNISFYDPWYAWNWGYGWGWGPSWAWGPSWGWGYGPGWGPSWSWGPGWGYGPGWGGLPPMANWRPNGNRPVAPNPGWSGNHRPGVTGGNSGLAHRVPSGNNGLRPGSSSGGSYSVNNHRPGVSGGNVATVPSSGMSNSRPGGHTGVVNNNGHWEYVNGGHRVPAGTVSGASNSSTNNNRRPGTVSSGSSHNSNRVTTNTNSNRNNYNYNSNSNNSVNSNRSFNTGRSGSSNRGGSFGGSRSTGGTRSGGGGGRHR